MLLILKAVFLFLCLLMMIPVDWDEMGTDYLMLSFSNHVQMFVPEGTFETIDPQLFLKLGEQWEEEAYTIEVSKNKAAELLADLYWPHGMYN